MRISPLKFLWAATLGLSALTALPGDALACGGFFCSQNAPVNQAAERIVFANDGQGTITAVIQIMYEGPSEKFSWLLPSPSVPDEVNVSSDVAFQRLQAATNPSYTLTTRVEGECKPYEPYDDFAEGSGSGGSSSSGTDGGGGESGGVTVEASGVVGAFDWVVISVDPTLDAPVDAATMWLEENSFDVTTGGAKLIAPYLEEGMYLVALKLVKGADTGSIRPIVLEYESAEPMIPIQLTAVAANDDMGVMAWLLAEERGVPKNYLSLELNEAQINWFNANSNYNDVVIRAAKEAGGQGFVTEFAGPSDTLDQVIWTSYDDRTWTGLNEETFSSFGDLFLETYYAYGSFDGFWDAAREAVTLPQDVSFDDFELCPYCYYDDIELDPSEYLAALEEQVIAPFRLMQDLFDDHEYTTRIYTTMSASDMTLDPVFTYNPDLDEVSNLHTAERVIECNPDIYESEAPWRIEFPQGGVIRGTAEDAARRNWPDEIKDQPANLVVSQLSESGAGQILVDNGDEVAAALKEYNDSLGLPSEPDEPESQAKRSPGCSLAGRLPALPFATLALGFGLAGILGARRRRR